MEKSFLTVSYVIKVRKEIANLEKQRDLEMANAVYVDFLQDFVLQSARGKINTRLIARAIHKHFNFKIAL